MGYKVRNTGMNEVNAMLEKLEQGVNGIAAQAVYEGAGIVAEELNKQVKGIQTAPFKYASRGNRRLPSPEEKAAIEGRVGIARFDNQGGTYVQTSVGFSNAGYADVAGHIRPVPLLVNAINSGTSFMKKQPFVRKAASSGGKKAAAAMIKTVEEKLEALTKE